MNLIDLREQNGPFWAAYQEERRRSGIIDNPDFVPEWFLRRVMRNRLAAAYVALEQSRDSKSEFDERKKAWDALRVLEAFVGGYDPDGVRAQVLAGLLGAQEIETARELREEAAREFEMVEVEQCYTACYGGYGSAPERCAYPVGHEGKCAP